MSILQNMYKMSLLPPCILFEMSIPPYCFEEDGKIMCLRPIYLMLIMLIFTCLFHMYLHILGNRKDK